MTIKEQLQQGQHLREGDDVEYKSAKGGFPQSFWETFSAFANTRGGTIVLGVKQKGEEFVPDRLTEEDVSEHRKHFWDDAHNKTCVSVPLLVESDIEEVVTGGGCHLLIFHIPCAPYTLRPVHLTPSPFGHTYRRCHEGDYVCRDDEVGQMFSDANNRMASADCRILRGYDMGDIDPATLQRYRRLYDLRHEGHPWSGEDDITFLEHIGAYRKDRTSTQEGFTVAGMLMFGKTASIIDPECCPNYFPDYREHLTGTPDTRWSDRLYPDGTWEANLFQFYSQVLPRIQQALPVPFRLGEDMRRIDTTGAHVALREALTNCLVHCAYTCMGNITVDRYPDRIVMSNPGTMLVSLEEYLNGGHSVCRNPILQKMFVFLGMGEKGGSGSDTILKGWRDNGWDDMPTLCERFDPDRIEMTLPLPVTGGGAAEVNTYRDITVRQTIKNRISVLETDKILTNGFSPDKILTNTDILDKLTDICVYLSHHPHTKAAVVSVQFGMSRDNARKYLRILVAAGVVMPEGANKNRTYSMKGE